MTDEPPRGPWDDDAPLVDRARWLARCDSSPVRAELLTELADEIEQFRAETDGMRDDDR